MADHKPTQNPPERGRSPSAMQSYVQVEKIAQIAFILPCAAVIGWLGGGWLDAHLHQSWMTLGGFILGCIAGMTSAIKLAMSMVAEPKGGAGSASQHDDEDGDHSR